MAEENLFELDFEEENTPQPQEDDKILKVAETVAERVARAILEQQNVAMAQQQPVDNRLPEEVELENLRKEIADLERRIEEEFQRDPSSSAIAALQIEKMNKENRVAVLTQNIPLKRELMETRQLTQTVAQLPVRVTQLVNNYREQLRKRFPPDRAAQLEAEMHQSLMEVGAKRPDVIFDDAQVGQLITLWIAQKFAEMAPPYDAGANDWGTGSAVKNRQTKEQEARLYEIAKRHGLQGEEAKAFVERVMNGG